VDELAFTELVDEPAPQHLCHRKFMAKPLLRLNSPFRSCALISSCGWGGISYLPFRTTRLRSTILLATVSKVSRPSALATTGVFVQERTVGDFWIQSIRSNLPRFADSAALIRHWATRKVTPLTNWSLDAEN